MGLLFAATKTRPVFWHFTTLAEGPLVRARGDLGVRVPLRRRAADRALPARPGRPVAPGRVARAAGAVGRRPGAAVLASHDRAPRPHGRAGRHGAIFYGFIVLFAGTVILGFDTDFLTPVFGVSYFHGNFYLVYKEVLNVFGTALIVGLLVMMIRRAIVRPRKLDYARPDRAPGDPQYDRRVYEIGDWVFVGTLLVIALTGFLLEGVRIAMSDPGYGGTQFGGWIVAQALTGLSHSTLAGAPPRAVVVSRAARDHVRREHPVHQGRAHAVELRQPVAARSAGRQAAGARSRPSAPHEPAGYGALADFSPLHLLQLDACTKCGRCHEACPANATGRPLSPRDVILELREQRQRRAARPTRDRRRARLAGRRHRQRRRVCSERDRRGRRSRRDDLVVHAVQRMRRDLSGRDRAGADHQPATPPAGRGG